MDSINASQAACEEHPARRCSAQFRVVWKREGWVKPKKKNYWTKKGAEKLLTLLGDEPWKAFGKEPNERYCCNGHECGCMGATWEEMLMEGRKDFPRLEYARLEQRTVVMGDWEQNPAVRGDRRAGVPCKALLEV